MGNKIDRVVKFCDGGLLKMEKGRRCDKSGNQERSSPQHNTGRPQKS